MTSVFRSTRIVFAVGVVLLAAACGGGDGNSPPVVSQPGTLTFQVGSLVVDENAGTASIAIARIGGSDGAVSVTVASSDGSARAAEDYSVVSTTVTFAAGDAVAKTVSVPVLDDGTAEFDETLTLTLSAPGGGASLGTTTTAALTIRDNDRPAAAIAATIKQLTFTWASVPGATSYRVMRSPDGTSEFTQVGQDHPAAATSATLDIAVHQHDWLNTRYRVDACNAHACSSSDDMSALNAMVQSIGYFKASNPGVTDLFGTSIALSADGNTLAIGAVNEDSSATGVNGSQMDESARSAGAVYVFVRIAGQWSQEAYVKASNTGTRDLFGAAVALSADGNTLAVGAPGEASRAPASGGSPTDNSAPGSGAVYVFARTPGLWSEQAFIKASNAEQNDEFGFSIALSDDGNTLAVSARAEASRATGIDGDQADNGAFGAGAAYVFTRGAGQWSQQAYVKASNTEAGDLFGWVLALSGDGSTLAVAAADEASSATGVGGVQTDNSAPSSGAVYVYTRVAGQWSQQAYVKASNTETLDIFGSALALNADGTTLAVSSLNEASRATGIDGDQTDNGASFAGAVYVFTFAAGQWSQQAYVKASNTEAEDQFGHSVALSDDGNTLAVGANAEDSRASGIAGDQSDNGAVDAGAAYLFSRTAGQWSQQAYVKASNPGEFDDFGRALALSADGSTLAIGAIFESSSATGVGGEQNDDSVSGSGAVYLY